VLAPIDALANVRVPATTAWTIVDDGDSLNVNGWWDAVACGRKLIEEIQDLPFQWMGGGANIKPLSRD
jgi:hypothetical protein